ncbi:hypothetical protein NMG60_11018530 [Bertholletia excelsa]
MCSLEKRGSLFVLTLTGDDQHRLNPTLLDAISAALHRVRSEASGASTALITTAYGKFFSNGYDLAWGKSGGPAAATKDRLILMSSKFRSVIRELISLPMPTIAAVTGHASAGGFIFALCHDYILMRKDKGFLYMSELDISLPVPAWFITVLEAKIGSPAARRDVMLRAAKLTAEAAVDRGIIQSAHDSAEETVVAALTLGEKLVSKKWDGQVYGQIRMVMLADLLSTVSSDETGEDPVHVNVVVSRL